MNEPVYTWMEVLQNKWWVFVVALLASLVCMPIVRFIAYRKGIVDRPDDLLKPHGRPVAYLGGLAMCVGLLAGFGAYVATTFDAESQWNGLVEELSQGRLARALDNPLLEACAVGLACVAITLVGLIDDLRKLSPRRKIVGQLLAAGILLLGGVGNRMGTIVLSPLGLEGHAWLQAPLSAAMCFLTVIAACNATNLLDGLDGLCGGVTGIIALGFLALATSLATFGNFPYTGSLRVVLCLAMAGAVAGFLPYNLPPASIFMGDAGSMLLGFFVATMMAMFCQEGHGRWFMGSLVVFALPILDTGLAVVRRARSGKSIMAGDRSHLYDQLVDRGMSVKQVVVLFYLLGLLAAVIGVAGALALQLRYAVILYAACFVIAWIIFLKLGMVKPAPREPKNQTKG
jgi:UDP-GlcNAc:undecaprenyl-phosphate GlcNAc-1-phosphate transferase